MQSQLEEQRLVRAKKDEEERRGLEKELNEKLEREKRLQKELEDERRERERKFEEQRLEMSKQLLQQKLLQDKKDEEERLRREKEQSEILEKEQRLAKDLEEKQKEVEKQLQEEKLEMEKKFEEERTIREKQLYDKLDRERQLAEKKVKEELNLESLRQRKAREENDRLEREKIEHQRRLQELESIAKQEAKDHINSLTNLLSAEKDLLVYEIQKGKEDEASMKGKKTKELDIIKIENYSKALAEEQRKLVAQLQQQSESDDTFQLQIQKHYSKNNTTDDNDNKNNVINDNNHNFDNFRIMRTQPLDPSMMLNNIEINDMNMAFTPELSKALPPTVKSLDNIGKLDAMKFTPDKAIVSSMAPNKVKSKQEVKKMKSNIDDEEIATVASFLSNGSRTKDHRSSREKNLEVDIVLKKAALQQKIALQELAEARLEVNIAVMKSQKKLIEKIANDVFVKSKPKQFGMKAPATILKETIKNNNKKIIPVKKPLVDTKKKTSRRRKVSHDSIRSTMSDDEISITSSQVDDNSTFLTEMEDDNSSLMSLESLGSLESIEESIDGLGFDAPKPYKWKTIGRYSSVRAAEVAMQMATQKFDDRPSIDDTRKYGRQKFDLNGDIFDTILQPKKKRR